MDTTKSYGISHEIRAHNRLHILYLATTMHPTLIKAGGIISHTKGILQGFIDNHAIVTLACTESFNTKTITQLSHKTYILRNPPILAFLRWKLNCICSTIFFTIQSLSFLKVRSINCIYQRYTPFNMTGILLSWIKKIPCIIEYNGSEVWISKNWSQKKRPSLLWLMHIIERFILRYASLIVVVSQELKTELINRNIKSTKIIVYPNGVDTQLCNSQRFTTESLALRTNLEIKKKTVFGFVGTFNYWHGINVIQHMIQQLKNEDVHFIVIGDGPLCTSFTKFIKDNHIDHLVTAPGLLAHEQALHYLNACDVFLCPTQKNQDNTQFFGSPTKLFEYMSLAKPIIASDIGQIKEIIQPALTLATMSHHQSNAVGFLIDSDSPENFVACARYILSCDQKLLKIIGDNARKKVLKQYTWKQHVEHIIKQFT